MDQESFRQLLHSSKSATSPAANTSAHVRGSLLSAATGNGKKKQKTVDASQPAFKPRTLKKSAKGEEYRDRASERRLGVNNDYAQVEALAEDFERRNAENEDREAVEQQRKYLGGDSEHTVLVKGLDFALLEQNRARVAAETAATEDVSLEQAFLETSAQPKKRTRADILRELKSKRGEGAGDAVDAPSESAPAPRETDKALEAAKKAGKFKPIGFKPIGGSTSGAAEGKVKRKKKVKAGEPEENGDRKKKRKVGGDAPAPAAGEAKAEPGSPVAGPSTEPAASLPKPPPVPEPEPMDEDFDIFADAGEYTGVDLGDDDDDSDGEGAPKPPSSRTREGEEGELSNSNPSRPGKWLATSDDEREPTPPPLPIRDSNSASRSTSPQRRPDHEAPPEAEEDGEVEEERPMRLQPLASSALPSIKELLAISDEVEKEEKRKARKEKKKGGGGPGGGGTEKDTKAKVERDYQRLKAYTDKKSK